MMELPAPLQRQLDRLEDALLEGRAITEGVEFDAITGFFEDEHLDGLPQVLAHGFVAALPTAFGALFQDQRLIEALALAPAEALDAALRLQFMTACVAEVLLAEPGDTLVAGHLRCGLLALRAATSEAVLALADDGEALIWAGIFPDHEAFEADLRERGYWLSLTDWEALPVSERLTLWG